MFICILAMRILQVMHRLTDWSIEDLRVDKVMSSAYNFTQCRIMKVKVGYLEWNLYPLEMYKKCNLTQ